MALHSATVRCRRRRRLTRVQRVGLHVCVSRSHLCGGCSDQAIAAVSHVLEPPKAVDNHGAIAAPPARVYASLILDTFEILGTSEVRPHHLINSHNTHTHTHTQNRTSHLYEHLDYSTV